WNPPSKRLITLLLSAALAACSGGSGNNPSNQNGTSAKVYENDRTFGSLHSDGFELLVPGKSSDSLTGMTGKLINLDEHPKKDAIKSALPSDVDASSITKLIEITRQDNGKAEDFANSVEVAMLYDF